MRRDGSKSLVEKLAIIAIAAIVIFFIFPHFWSPPKKKAPEAAVKSHTHSIQIAVEMYKVDHGEYPAYLLGGDKEGWDYFNANLPEGAEQLSDPLIEGGYLEYYPSNAFYRVKGWSHRWDRRTVGKFAKTVGKEGPSFDPRFGLNGDKMGNVLMEPFIFVEPFGERPEGYPRLCPGQFIYRAFGEISKVDQIETLDIKSPDDYEYDSYSHFLLAGVGSIRNKGIDVIRWTDLSGNIPDKFPYISDTDFYRTPEGVDIKIPLRLPEVFGADYDNDIPLWPPWSEANSKLVYGAPDGFRDGIIITLIDN